MNCNRYRPETQSALHDGQIASLRPMKEGETFGKLTSFLSLVEFQYWRLVHTDIITVALTIYLRTFKFSNRR